jgi:hypothetical protein
MKKRNRKRPAADRDRYGPIMRWRDNTAVILALADYIRGEKVAVIGSRYGFDDSAITRVARRMGVETRGRGRPLNRSA